MTTETGTSNATLRRAFAGVEFLFALILVLGGIDSTFAHRVGGDGIATGLANGFGPAFVGMGLGIGYAAYGTWQGISRWPVRQLKMLALSVGLMVATFFIMVATV
jgi:hypothetical protein